MKKHIAFILFTLLALISFESIAGVATIFIENDVVNDTDKDYTHGTRFQYEFDKVPWFINQWLPEESEEVENTFSVSVSQYLYTPYDITTEEYIFDSRPYGGWLYVSPTIYVRRGSVMDTFQFDIGVTGEASLAGDTQKEIHEWLDSRDPQGWENQIEEELGVNIVYNRKHKVKFSSWFDIIPTYGGSLGNIYTYAGAGSLFRLGYNLPEDFGLTRIEPTTRNKNDFYIYVMCDIYGKYIAHNTFVEGSLFKEDEKIVIDKEDFVGEISTGIVAGNSNFEFGFLYTHRTKEYEEQESSQEFGSIIFSKRF